MATNNATQNSKRFQSTTHNCRTGNNASIEAKKKDRRVTGPILFEILVKFREICRNFEKFRQI